MNTELVAALGLDMVSSFHDYLAGRAVDTVDRVTEIAGLHMSGMGDAAIAAQLGISAEQTSVALRSFAEFITSGSFAAGLAAAVAGTEGSSSADQPSRDSVPDRPAAANMSHQGTSTFSLQPRSELLHIARAIISHTENPLPQGERPLDGNCRRPKVIDMNVTGPQAREALNRCINCVAKLRCLGIGLALRSLDGTPIKPPGIYGERTSEQVVALRGKIEGQSGFTVNDWAGRFITLASRQ